MKGLSFFLSLDGRIGRKKFWFLSTAIFAMGFAAAVLIAVALTVSVDESAADRWIDVVVVASLCPQFVVDVKRAHDRNIPFWVIALFYAAIIAHNVLLQLGWLVRWPKQNVFSPTGLSSFLVLAVLGIFSLALLIELGFRRGTIGPNRYGPDPLASS